MGLPLTFGLSGTLLKGALGDIFAFSGLPLTIGISGQLTYTPPREISGSIPLSFGLKGNLGYQTGGQMAFTLPAISAHFDGTVDTQGVLNVILPMLDVYMSARVSTEGVLSITLPKHSIKFTGQQEVQGVLNVILPRLGFKAAGVIDENGVLNVSLPMPRISLVAEVNNEGVLTVQLPAYRIHMDAYSSVEGTLNVVLPMLLFHAEQLIGSDDYLTMVMNTKNKALTLYNNYLFNSLCAFGGKHFGATDTGIFDLDSGTKDNGTPIEWNILTGYLDLEQGQKKKLIEAWASYKTDGDIKFTVVQPDGQRYEYILEGIDTTETGLRLKFGKGIRTKYVALNISNIDGSSIGLDELKLHLATSTFVKVR
jgi:hypothetical protein